jgi:ribosome-binding ATPase YchF (GTP1/OBG family)
MSATLSSRLSDVLNVLLLHKYTKKNKMTITINHNHKFDYKPYFEKIDTRLYGIESNQTRILLLLNKIRMTQEQLASELQAVKAQAEKAQAEIVAAVAALEAAILAAGNTTTAVDDALAALKTTVQAIDDLNADVVTEPQP